MQNFALQHPIIFSVLASPWTTLKTEIRKNASSWEMKSVSGHLNPFTATGYFDIPPPQWPTFLVTLFPILKEGMGLSLLDEFEVQYHVIKVMNYWHMMAPKLKT